MLDKFVVLLCLRGRRGGFRGYVRTPGGSGRLTGAAHFSTSEEAERQTKFFKVNGGWATVIMTYKDAQKLKLKVP